MRLFDVKKILAAEVITGEHLLGRRVEVIFGCLLYGPAQYSPVRRQINNPLAD